MDFLIDLTKSLVWLAVAIASVVIGFLVTSKLRSQSTSKSGLTYPDTKSAGMIPTRKSEFGNEITTARLIVDGGPTEVTFTDLTSVDVVLDYLDVTLVRKTFDTNLLLGHHDLLICTGTPEACELVDTCHVRIWSRGKLIYDQRLAGVEIADGCILAYTENGADVILVRGDALTMIIDEI